MKKTVSIILCAAIALGSAAACTPFAPAAHYEARDVAVQTVDGKTLTLSCLFRSDLPEVPFLSAEDFFNQLFTEPVKVTGDGNGKYTVSDGQYCLELDAKNDTASSDCLEKVFSSNKVKKQYHNYDDATYIQEEGFEYIGDCKPFYVDFGKYQIDVAEKDGKVYLPFCTFSDWFSYYECSVGYRFDALTFQAGYEGYTFHRRPEDLVDTRDKATAAFTYHNLCFAMDISYGKPSKALLAESIREKGFDEALTSYNVVTKRIKELLLSERTEDYCKGMRLLQYYLADGGHTDITEGMEQLMEKYKIATAAEVAKELFGDREKEEIAHMEAAADKEHRREEQRRKLPTYSSSQPINTWGTSCLFRSGDTFIFDCGGFGNSEPAALKESLDIAAEQKAKNFIFDISCCNDGLMATVTYIVSVLCGEDTHCKTIAMTGNTVREKARIDKNPDGKFDQKDDAVKYDFRFGILCTQYTYSAANMLACVAQDSGVAILGETSDGGCCNLTGKYYREGGLHPLSSGASYVHPDGNDIDGGATPDIPLPGADKGYVGFYSVDAMKKGLEAFYGQ